MKENNYEDIALPSKEFKRFLKMKKKFNPIKMKTNEKFRRS